MPLSYLTLCQTCKFLQLKPRENERAFIKFLVWEITKEDNTSGEIEEYIVNLIGGSNSFSSRWFCAWCKKMDQCCVLTGSIAINEETPLIMLIINLDRLVNCDQHKPDELNPNKPFINWILDYLVLD